MRKKISAKSEAGHGKQLRASLKRKSFDLPTVFLLTLNWLSFLLFRGLEFLLNPRPEKRFELQHERLD